jgi:hypothetical protein
MNNSTAKGLERELALVPVELTEPEDDECVLCYAARMLTTFGCDETLRWVRRWRERRQPRATGLERRMASRGGFCDCEVFMNGWRLRADLLVRDEDGELTDPFVPPPCAGIGPRSSQPCANWEPRRRGGW